MFASVSCPFWGPVDVRLESLAIQLIASDACGDDATVESFLDLIGENPGGELPRYTDLLEILSELQPTVRRQLRRDLGV